MESISIVPKKEVEREDILAVEAYMSEFPGAVFGDSDLCPLTHTFVDGKYIRQMVIPKGTAIVGKIHKHDHPVFLISGSVIMYSEHGGKEHLSGPLCMESKAGVKRVILAMTDAVFITVHENADNGQDLKKIEEFVIAPSFEEYEAFKIAADKPKEITV
jgi:hypothetical protein